MRTEKKIDEEKKMKHLWRHSYWRPLMDWRRQSSASLPPGVLGLRSSGVGGGTVPVTARKETCTFFLSFLLLLSLSIFLFFFLFLLPIFILFYFFFTQYTHSTLNLHNSKLLESVSAACVLVSVFLCLLVYLFVRLVRGCGRMWWSGYTVSCHWVWGGGSLLACCSMGLKTHMKHIIFLLFFFLLNIWGKTQVRKAVEQMPE